MFIVQYGWYRNGIIKKRKKVWNSNNLIWNIILLSCYYLTEGYILRCQCIWERLKFTWGTPMRVSATLSMKDWTSWDAAKNFEGCLGSSTLFPEVYFRTSPKFASIETTGQVYETCFYVLECRLYILNDCLMDLLTYQCLKRSKYFNIVPC